MNNHSFFIFRKDYYAHTLQLAPHTTDFDRISFLWCFGFLLQMLLSYTPTLCSSVLHQVPDLDAVLTLPDPIPDEEKKLS